jgi:signal peptidase II
MPPEVDSRSGSVSGFAVPLGVAAVVFVADQATKVLVRRTIDPGDSIPVLDGFVDIVHARNPGAAFSFLADAPAWFRGPFFLVITIIAVIVLLYVIGRLPREDRLMRVALGGVLGGALGNLVDRLMYGEVTDFVDVHWRTHHWPAFNVADSSITLAVIAVVAQALFSARTQNTASEGSPDTSA